MNIAVIGCGYVGLPTGAGFAEAGHQVVCLDNDREKIAALQAGKVPLYEEGLSALLAKNRAAGRLSFSAAPEDVAEAELVIIAVGTPCLSADGTADLRDFYAALEETGRHITERSVALAVKSTVPTGTGDEVEDFLHRIRPSLDIDVISLPEFLREGHAVQDFFHPDRVVAGVESERARRLVEKLYAPLAPLPLLIVGRRAAETIKYASNAFLAMKVQYINEMADFCEQSGVDVREVARGMGLDRRISPLFLEPGPGYGGSCFGKDSAALCAMARRKGVELSLVAASLAANARRQQRMAGRIWQSVATGKNPRLAVLGLAFKQGTDDCRESPALTIVRELLRRQCELTVYDPQAMPSAFELLGKRLHYAGNMYAALHGADGLAILTEWPEFSRLDLKKAASLMRGRSIIDCRNVLDAAAARAAGFSYQGIGRG